MSAINAQLFESHPTCVDCIHNNRNYKTDKRKHAPVQNFVWDAHNLNVIHSVKDEHRMRKQGMLIPAAAFCVQVHQTVHITNGSCSRTASAVNSQLVNQISLAGQLLSPSLCCSYIVPTHISDGISGQRQKQYT